MQIFHRRNIIPYQNSSTVAQILTETVKRVWAEKGKPASETRSKFQCPWGADCRNKGQDAARPCNNVHDMTTTGTIATVEVINTARRNPATKTYKDLVNVLFQAFENA